MANALTSQVVWDLLEEQQSLVHDIYDAAGAPLYAALCCRDRFEIPELLAAVRKTKGTILELAAGAGRITLPLLAAGRHVVATELSPTMLDLLEKQLGAVPRVMRERCEIQRADMTSFRMGRTFGSIVLGATSVSLLSADGRSSLFHGVVGHLERDGAFLMTNTCLAAGSSVATEVDYAATAPDGTEYIIAERVADDGQSRQIAITRRREAETTDQATIFTGTIGIVSDETLIDEAERAGLILSGHMPCVGLDTRYRASLFTFKPRRLR